jgi:CHAD domain-containing protein
MTPDLAGFIADGNETQPWEDTLDSVIAALTTAFTVLPDRAADAAGSRTWLDTFDWRLHKAGLTLQYTPAHRGGDLRLSGPGAAGSGTGARATGTAQEGTAQEGTAQVSTAQVSTAQAEIVQAEIVQPVTSWRATRPHLLADLPDGPVTARIGRLITPRALLPVAVTTAQTHVYRLTNDDGKTVARLLVERQNLSGPTAANGTGQQETPPRLQLTGVRGYRAEAARARALIAAVPGVRPAASAPLEDALRALGRRPGDYTNKVEAKITAAMPAGMAVATVLLYLLDAVEANVAGVLADIDTEFLHDLRVAVRRTRSALKLFGDTLGGLTGTEREFFAAEFKWVGDLTTPTRDLDVHLLDFEATAQSLTAAKPDDLEPFRDFLAERRRKEFRALVRGLRSARFTELTGQWRAKLDRILAGKAARKKTAGATTAAASRSLEFSKARASTAGFLAAERTRAAFAKVAKRGAAITDESPAESLHDLRKRCKELRYALEFFAPLHDPASYAKVVKDLKRLQDCLGEFQDSEVQIAEIRSLAADLLASDLLAGAEMARPAVTLLAMGEVTASLAARQRFARTDFAERFAAFADADGQRRMAALLRTRLARAPR